jgi:rod shape-determining protein MreD
MWWGSFLVTLLVTHLLQTTIIGFLQVGWIDLYLALAILCGLTMPAHDARLAALLVGLLQDLGTIGPIGVHGFGLGLVGLLATLLRPGFNLLAWYSRALIGLMAAVPGLLVVRLHQILFQRLAWESVWSEVGLVLLTALFATLVATLVTQLPSLGVGRRRRMETRPIRR